MGACRCRGRRGVCSLKHLADRFAGKELPLMKDEDFRQQAARQLKTGLWMLLFPYLSKDA